MRRRRGNPDVLRQRSRTAHHVFGDGAKPLFCYVDDLIRGSSASPIGYHNPVNIGNPTIHVAGTAKTVIESPIALGNRL